MGAPSKLRLGGDFLPPDSTALLEQDDLLRVLCAAFAIFAVKILGPFGVQPLLGGDVLGGKRKAYAPEKTKGPAPAEPNQPET
jgi:hypothetical protein